MSRCDKNNSNDDYYTPPEVFKALGCAFDMDVASPLDRKFCHVPAQEYVSENSLNIR